MTQLKNKRIFIIEDNLNNRSLMQLLLEEAGAKVAFERWGMDFLDRMKNFSPIDLIALDLQFPNDVTGYDIFKKIREQEAFFSIPIIAISAKDPSIAIPKVQEIGFTGFIPKPISFEKFASQIAQVIEGESVWLSQSN